MALKIFPKKNSYNYFTFKIIKDLSSRTFLNNQKITFLIDFEPKIDKDTMHQNSNDSIKNMTIKEFVSHTKETFAINVSEYIESIYTELNRIESLLNKTIDKLQKLKINSKKYPNTNTFQIIANLKFIENIKTKNNISLSDILMIEEEILQREIYKNVLSVFDNDTIEKIDFDLIKNKALDRRVEIYEFTLKDFICKTLKDFFSHIKPKNNQTRIFSDSDYQTRLENLIFLRFFKPNFDDGKILEFFNILEQKVKIDTIQKIYVQNYNVKIINLCDKMIEIHSNQKRNLFDEMAILLKLLTEKQKKISGTLRMNYFIEKETKEQNFTEKLVDLFKILIVKPNVYDDIKKILDDELMRKKTSLKNFFKEEISTVY
ncbi:hypothetical protein GVAV_000069 [Gurleya vavrai]